MFLKSKGWRLVSALGHGVMLSLAMNGAMRLISRHLGAPMSDHAAGNLFLVSSLLVGALCGYFGVRAMQQPDSNDSSQTPPCDQ
jgi:hypothetical protein